MGYGNGMAGSKLMIRKPASRMKMYSREFADFYINTDSTKGDCKVTCSSRRLNAVNGTISYRKGNPNIVFTSDDGRTIEKFSLRNTTNNSISRGVHLLTFSV